MHSYSMLNVLQCACVIYIYIVYQLKNTHTLVRLPCCLCTRAEPLNGKNPEI